MLSPVTWETPGPFPQDAQPFSYERPSPLPLTTVRTTRRYAVAVGAVGLVLSLIALFLLIHKPEPMACELFRVRDTPVTVRAYTVLFT